MNDDLERWINLEGPPPDDIRRLLDAACGIHRPTPEEQARMDARFFAALAEDRRRRAQRRVVKRALGGVVAAACLAGAIVLALRLAGSADRARPRGALPNAGATLSSSGPERRT